MMVRDVQSPAKCIGHLGSMLPFPEGDWIWILSNSFENGNWILDELLPESLTARFPLKIYQDPKGKESSNYHFSGAMLNFRGVSFFP